MAEKKTPIRQKDSEIMAGFFINLECMCCGHTQAISGYSKAEVVEEATREGWKNLDSDMYMMVGHYCGCDYKI